MLDSQPTTNGLTGNGTRYKLLFLLLGATSLLLVSLAYSVEFLNTPHPAFPLNVDITVAEGLTQNDVTKLLEDAHIVRSSLYLYLHLEQRYPREFVRAGTYRFPRAMTTEEVAESLITGKNGSPLLRFTLPEGFRAGELLSYLPPHLASSTGTDFREFEGYLFPDTYFVSRDTTLEEVVELLQKTFDEKIAPVREEIEQSGFTEAEVVVFASILEREAKDVESKKIVSGILQNRLEIGMPLQVDAVFDYLLGKTSVELTDEDLDLDSPYNTYRYAGLPPGPISNPGLESILAVLEPAETNYLYYLTGDDGVFHYAETFEEHKRNKEEHLR
jgi:UPF0755 protein